MSETAHVVDTDPHPLFRVYSAGNFGEVAPQRLSPMSWSLVGEPMERATRSLARRLWGRRSWAEGSHFVFLGYFGCRPYHNLSAYCQLSCSIPGLRPQDVTNAYFEGIAPPEEFRAIRESPVSRVRSLSKLLRELRAVGGRLTGLEQRVAALELGVRLAVTADNPIAVHDVFRRARETLIEAWSCHIICTAGLVPLTVLQRKAYEKLLRHPDEAARWLTRPRELVWERLHAAAATGDQYGPGAFLNSSFYEVADSHVPWRDYTVRHRISAPPTTGKDLPLHPADAMIGMLDSWPGHPARALATTVGETMAGREQSKSLVMRTLHVFRLTLPRLAEQLGVDEQTWPYLTVGELDGMVTRPSLLNRAAPRKDACAAALRVDMPEHLDLTHADSQPRPWMPSAQRRTRGVAPGIAVGPVISPTDELLGDGYVLVCDSADADVAPLLPFVDGVLSDRGSELSHIAILCREYQIPCVVGFSGAAKLKTGTGVSINGSTGEVIVYEQ
ncbi:MAG: PEP-utilizing enzyme [Pseudonocardiaceae bacterium]